MSLVIGRIQTRLHGALDVLLSSYANNALSVHLESPSGDPVAKLSVNLPAYARMLERGEFFVKTYGENEALVPDCQLCGLFVDTGQSVPIGPYGLEAPIWRIKEAA